MSPPQATGVIESSFSKKVIAVPYDELFARAKVRAMARKLVWIDSQNFEGLGCSQCQWVFKPSGPFVGRALDKMKDAYEAERDKEFAVHVCAKFPRKIDPKK
jgi:hypothetical protein